RRRVDGGVGVVAVGVVGDVAGLRRARQLRLAGIAEAVTVAVAIERRAVVEVDRGIGVVDLAVAVVVDVIADLGRAGVDRGVVIVAVAALGDVARGRLGRGHRLGGVTVAVAIGVLIERAGGGVAVGGRGVVAARW